MPEDRVTYDPRLLSRPGGWRKGNRKGLTRLRLRPRLSLIPFIAIPRSDDEINAHRFSVTFVHYPKPYIFCTLVCLFSYHSQRNRSNLSFVTRFLLHSIRSPVLPLSICQATSWSKCRIPAPFSSPIGSFSFISVHFPFDLPSPVQRPVFKDVSFGFGGADRQLAVLTSSYLSISAPFTRRSKTGV